MSAAPEDPDLASEERAPSGPGPRAVARRMSLRVSGARSGDASRPVASGPAAAGPGAVRGTLGLQSTRRFGLRVHSSVPNRAERAATPASSTGAGDASPRSLPGDLGVMAAPLRKHTSCSPETERATRDDVVTSEES